MRRIESLGLEYATLLRRRIIAVEELDRIDAQIVSVQEAIMGTDTDILYSEVSREWPVVPDERPTERMTVPDGWACPGPSFCARYGTNHVHLESGQVWST